MKTKLSLIFFIFIMGMLVGMILSLIVIGFSLSDPIKNNSLNSINSSNFSIYSSQEAFYQYSIPNYSQEGYYQIRNEEAPFYFLECINSTLIITKNKIGCEKEQSK